MKEEKLLKMGQVAQRINRTTQTIANWYKAQKRGVGTSVILPEPVWIRGKRYFREEDIEVFEEFLKKTKKGDMVKYNKKYNRYKKER